MSSPLRYPLLFSPMTAAGLSIPNRIFMAAMSSHLAAPDGSVTPEMMAYYRERALGGAGVVTVEYTCVDRREGLAELLQLSLDSRHNLLGHHRLVDEIRRTGARAFIQLHHVGRQTSPANIEGRQPVGPSAIGFPFGSPSLSRELSAAEIEAQIQKFAYSAALAMEAGYEGIELHGAHGYLLHQFLSPLTNRRDDEWGGDFERRLKFPTAVIAAVKAVLGKRRPLVYRLSASEYYEGGWTVDDMVQIAPRLVAAGVDVINVSAGILESVEYAVDPMSMAPGWRLPMARRIRAAVNVPVITVGPFRFPALAEQALANGDVDGVTLGRALLADPQWPAKARAGLDAEIRACTSCNWCVGRNMKGTGCAENPRAGRELDSSIPRFATGRRAVVVGAGPGGVVAAVLLDQAGFFVQLFESGDTLGGGLISSAAPPFKDKLLWYRDYLQHKLEHSTVRLTLASAATVESILPLKPDLVILAVGARAVAQAIPGSELPQVHSAYQLLMNPGSATLAAIAAGTAVVYGGGETGCETAEYLAERGGEVFLITRSANDQLARSAERLYRKLLLARLRANPRITVIEKHELIRIAADHVEIRDANQHTRTLACANVVLAQGRATGSELAAALRTSGIECFEIGDTREIRRIGDAVSDAYLLVRTLAEREERKIAC